jgi:hypothetical protein
MTNKEIILHALNKYLRDLQNEDAVWNWQTIEKTEKLIDYLKK